VLVVRTTRGLGRGGVVDLSDAHVSKSNGSRSAFDVEHRHTEFTEFTEK
jgi:hypothetical protein